MENAKRKNALCMKQYLDYLALKFKNKFML